MVTATVQWDASNLFIAASVFKWQPVNLCSLNNFLEILEAPRPSFHPPYKCVRVLERKKRKAVNILIKQRALLDILTLVLCLHGGGSRVIKTSANYISPRNSSQGLNSSNEMLKFYGRNAVRNEGRHRIVINITFQRVYATFLSHAYIYETRDNIWRFSWKI